MVVDGMNLWSTYGLEWGESGAGKREDWEAQTGKCQEGEKRAGQERGSETGSSPPGQGIC